MKAILVCILVCVVAVLVAVLACSVGNDGGSVHPAKSTEPIGESSGDAIVETTHHNVHDQRETEKSDGADETLPKADEHLQPEPVMPDDADNEETEGERKTESEADGSPLKKDPDPGENAINDETEIDHEKQAPSKIAVVPPEGAENTEQQDNDGGTKYRPRKAAKHSPASSQHSVLLPTFSSGDEYAEPVVPKQDSHGETKATMATNRGDSDPSEEASNDETDHEEQAPPNIVVTPPQEDEQDRPRKTQEHSHHSQLHPTVQALSAPSASKTDHKRPALIDTAVKASKPVASPTKLHYYAAKRYRCGKQAKKYEPIGLGKNWEKKTKEHSWPWYILVQETLDGGYTFVRECLGGIIPVRDNEKESDIFVTSAKCFTQYRTEISRVPDPEKPSKMKKHYKYFLEERDPKNFRAFAGLHAKNTSKGALAIKAFRYHPKYEGKSDKGEVLFHNDIAVGQLNDTVKFSDEKIPICVPKNFRMVLREAECMMASWPPLKKSVPELRQVDIHVARAETCADGKGQYNGTMMFCASTIYKPFIRKFPPEMTGAPLGCRKTQKDKFGDPDPTGIWYLSGVAIADYYHLSNIPFLFSRVKTEDNRYIDWIESVSNELSLVGTE